MLEFTIASTSTIVKSKWTSKFTPSEILKFKLRSKYSVLYHNFDSDIPNYKLYLQRLIKETNFITTTVNVFIIMEDGSRKQLGMCIMDTDVTVVIKPREVSIDICNFKPNEYVILITDTLDYACIKEINKFRIVAFDKNGVLDDFEYYHNYAISCVQADDEDYILDCFKTLLSSYGIKAKSKKDMFRLLWLYLLFTINSDVFKNNNSEFITKMIYYMVLLDMDNLSRHLSTSLGDIIRNQITWYNKSYTGIKELLYFYCKIDCPLYKEYKKIYDKPTGICIKIRDAYIYMHNCIGVENIQYYNNTYIINLLWGIVIKDTRFLIINFDTGDVFTDLNDDAYKVLKSESELRKYLILN